MSPGRAAITLGSSFVEVFDTGFIIKGPLTDMPTIHAEPLPT